MWVFLYFEAFINVVFRSLQKFNIEVYTYPHKTIRNTSPLLRDSVDLLYNRGAIYTIPFKVCF